MNKTLPDILQCRIPPENYCRNPFAFAKEELLGAYLCSNIGGVLTAGKITELEVYIGSCDKACHAYPNKLTKRTATMFRKGRCAYVFLYTACTTSLMLSSVPKVRPMPY